jgi:hypothetical protein
VVLDEPEARALLFAAVQEGLVDTDPRIGDGFVAGVIRGGPAPELLDRALEQLVLGGKIWTPFPLPEDWHGELFESGTVVGAPRWKADEDLLESIDGNLILEMLRVRGQALHPETYDSILARLFVAMDRWSSLTDESLMEFNIHRVVQQSLGFTPSADPILLEAAAELSEASSAARPISDCVETYSRIIGTALEFDALSSLPFRAQPGPLLKLKEAPDDSGERMVIANVVCRELRTTPRASTLRGTLTLASSAEAVALRSKLNTWTDCLRCGDNRIDVVRREIEYAQRELVMARTWVAAGVFYTVIALPVSMLSSVSPVIAAALNWTVTVGGVVAAGASANLLRRNRWAMLGSVEIEP